MMDADQINHDLGADQNHAGLTTEERPPADNTSADVTFAWVTTATRSPSEQDAETSGSRQ